MLNQCTGENQRQNRAKLVRTKENRTQNRAKPAAQKKSRGKTKQNYPCARWERRGWPEETSRTVEPTVVCCPKAPT